MWWHGYNIAKNKLDNDPSIFKIATLSLFLFDYYRYGWAGLYFETIAGATPGVYDVSVARMPKNWTIG